MAALGGDARGFKPGRAAAHDQHAFRAGRRREAVAAPLELAARRRIDQAGDVIVARAAAPAHLVAGEARADVGGALGLGTGFAFGQDVFGVKVRVLGDAVLEQDSWMPQIAVGMQYKRNDQGAALRAIGARDDHGTDFYVSATKLFLDQSFLANLTLRETKANQIGTLGFGGDKSDRYSTQFETSLAYLLRRDLAVGVEYRTKPDNLKIAREDNWYDVFVAYQPVKNVSVTLAYAHLGNIVIKDKQRAPYLSVQVGF